MQFLRSIAAGVLVAIASLGLMVATPGVADAQIYRWNGYHSYPYYWSGNYGSYYNPYSAYSPYSNSYGAYGGYYNTNPYYNWSRSYPWGWYW
jgi:hypothetical protein